MKTHPIFLIITLVAISAGPSLPAAVPAQHAAQMAKSIDLFKSDVRILFKNNCVKCHGEEKIRAGLDLNTRETLLAGGENGPAIIPGNAADSILLHLIEHREEPFMPQGDLPKLSDHEIDQIAAWINTGAAYDAPLLSEDDIIAANGPMIITDDDRTFWSFKPLAAPSPPNPKNISWPQSSLDPFIAAAHESHNLSPNPRASPAILARRLYLDLTGLPPTPQEVEEFVKSSIKNPESSTEALIDKLLASPHYGEKWARHWLDLARFAESYGFEQDYNRPYAYHYRDFVIQALNQDMPYDQFVKWQLAGDEIAPDQPLALMATGFLGAGVFPTQLTEKEFESSRYDELDDMLATTGTAMLGLTIGCARCHDHKYDPIPTRDYYRLLSTFTTTIRSEIFVPVAPESAQRELDDWEKQHASLLKNLQSHLSDPAFDNNFRAWLASDAPAKELQSKKKADADRALAYAAFNSKSFDALTPDQRDILQEWFGSTSDAEWKKRHKDLQDHQAEKPPPGTAKVQVSSEGFTPVKHHADARGFPHFYPDTHILNRGDVHQKQEVATQGFLQVLTRPGKSESFWQQAPPENARTSHRRHALANWITDTEHGAGHLLARVIVNRLWYHHFGRGLVNTPSDFGLQGERPSHPELLDFLAQELIRNDWRLKPLHKLILLSATYQQSSATDPKALATDPENRFLWRYTARRLDAENLRDSILAVSGVLDPAMFGPGSLDEGIPRRSIYLMIKRSQLIPMMQAFDAPEPLVGQGNRPTTTVAPQALTLMNNPHVLAWSQSFASQLLPAAHQSLEQAIHQGFLTALARPPLPHETQANLDFLQQQINSYAADGKENAPLLALGDFCQVLISLNEFAYIQ